jgi:hypothetical protein
MVSNPKNVVSMMTMPCLPEAVAVPVVAVLLVVPFWTRYVSTKLQQGNGPVDPYNCGVSCTSPGAIGGRKICGCNLRQQRYDMRDAVGNGSLLQLVSLSL